MEGDALTPQKCESRALETTFPLIIYKLSGIIDNQQGLVPLKPTDLVQGTLDLLILKTLSLEPLSGWSIAKRIVQVSQEVLQVQQGSLYPALHRLEHQGWIKAEWKASEHNRRAKFYSLTAAGRKQLRSELDNWRRLSNAIGLVGEAT
jgi:PadR family transcriptional regulator, regulatory protein PadR